VVLDAAPCRLGPCVDAVAHRPALHEDDGVVPVLARDSRRQAKDMPCLRATGGEFKADRRKVVAFIDDEMTVGTDQIGYLALANKALDQRHVDHPGRLAAAAANHSIDPSVRGDGRAPACCAGVVR
jgi:hypothetical protein